jgi:hypothetical protein
MCDPSGIVDRMLPTRVDKWLRFATSCGLLLLLVAQQKVCPWLTTPPVVEEAAGPATPPPATPADNTGAPPDESERAPQFVPYVLSDPPTLRWPAAWSTATARETAGWHDGITASGQLHPTPTPDAAPDVDWTAGFRAARPTDDRVEAVADPPARILPTCLLSTVFPTGPPAA